VTRRTFLAALAALPLAAVRPPIVIPRDERYTRVEVPWRDLTGRMAWVAMDEGPLLSPAQVHDAYLVRFMLPVKGPHPSKFFVLTGGA
jgi:hypothetical protein